MQQKRDLEAFRHKRFVEDGSELPASSAMHTAAGDAPRPDCSKCIIHFDVDCFYAQVPAFVLHAYSSLPGMSCSCVWPRPPTCRVHYFTKLPMLATIQHNKCTQPHTHASVWHVA